MYHPWPSRLNSFKSYCENKNIKLLKDDILFIDRMLTNVHRDDFKAVLTAYAEKWLHGMGCVEKSSLSQNLGRKIANSWLIERCIHEERQKKL